MVTKIKTSFLKINISFFDISFLFLITLLLINSLRYIFQFNSSGTSPTYTDTPLWFHIFKYSCLLLFSLYIFIHMRSKARLNKYFVYTSLVILFIFAINIFNYIFYSKISQDFKIIFGFIFIFSSVYLLSNNKLTIFEKAFWKAINAIVYYLIIFNIIAIFNFLIFDRLPALAYAGSLVRFGSFWDDPNGFGMFSSFLFIYLFLRKKYILSLLTLINIMLTVSFSSYLILALGMILLSFKNKRVFVITLMGIILSSILVYMFYDFLILIYELKSGSIEAHGEIDLLFSFLPLVNSSIITSESWLITMFLSYFPISIIFIFIFIFIFIRFILSKNIDYYELYLLLFIFGNLFIPYIYTFPNDFVFFIVLALYFRKLTMVSNYE